MGPGSAADVVSAVSILSLQLGQKRRMEDWVSLLRRRPSVPRSW